MSERGIRRCRDWREVGVGERGTISARGSANGIYQEAPEQAATFSRGLAGELIMTTRATSSVEQIWEAARGFPGEHERVSGRHWVAQEQIGDAQQTFCSAFRRQLCPHLTSVGVAADKVSPGSSSTSLLLVVGDG